MGIYCTFSLCVGFKIKEEEINKIFLRKEISPGEFHFEKRFDPKTGLEVKPEKIWDKKPNTTSWYEVDDLKFENNFFSEFLIDALSNKFNCEIESYFNEGADHYMVFSTVVVGRENLREEGKVSFWNDSISVEEIVDASLSLKELGERLKEAGLNVEKPMVFIASSIG